MSATDGLRTEEKVTGGIGHSFQSTILDGLKGLRIAILVPVYLYF